MLYANLVSVLCKPEVISVFMFYCVLYMLQQLITAVINHRDATCLHWAFRGSAKVG